VGSGLRAPSSKPASSQTVLPVLDSALAHKLPRSKGGLGAATGDLRNWLLARKQEKEKKEEEGKQETKEVPARRPRAYGPLPGKIGRNKGWDGFLSLAGKDQSGRRNHFPNEPQSRRGGGVFFSFLDGSRPVADTRAYRAGAPPSRQTATGGDDWGGHSATADIRQSPPPPLESAPPSKREKGPTTRPPTRAEQKRSEKNRLNDVRELRFVGQFRRRSNQFRSNRKQSARARHQRYQVEGRRNTGLVFRVLSRGEDGPASPEGEALPGHQGPVILQLLVILRSGTERAGRAQAAPKQRSRSRASTIFVAARERGKSIIHGGPS